MDIRIRDITEALRQDQYHRIAKVLEENGFMKNIAVPLNLEMDQLMETILRHASILEFNGALSENMANVLIRYFAGTNYVHEFAQLVVEAANIDDKHKAKRELTHMLEEDKNPYEATHIIMNLSENEFKGLMRSLSEGKPETVYTVFMFPIVRYIYNREIIPRHILFAIIAMNKMKPVASLDDILKELS